jgi:hypothetical protein
MGFLRFLKNLLAWWLFLFAGVNAVLAIMRQYSGTLMRSEADIPGMIFFSIILALCFSLWWKWKD